jgi:hypothetical protein
MLSNFFKHTKSKVIKPSTKVYRKQVIEGFAIPAIIHNMNYFFVDLDVYENGRVHCWNFEDFDHFVKDVKRGWVTTSIPDGEAISIHGLGTWTIAEGEWLFSNETFITYVQSLIKDLNPHLDNIYKYSEKKVNGIIIGENGNGTIYKDLKKTPNDPFPDKIKGDSVNMFYKSNHEFYLVKVNAFADESIQLSRLETPVELSFLKFEQLVAEEVISTDVPVGASVQIYGLGKFSIQSVDGYAKIDEKVLEVKDLIRELKGEPSTIEICRQLHKDYLENPTIKNRERLKEAYENVPEHQRIYVGDMDTKDIEVRIIIYGDQEIENWSHYRLAKQLGEELPYIRVPKPRDYENNS